MKWRQGVIAWPITFKSYKRRFYDYVQNIMIGMLYEHYRRDYAKYPVTNTQEYWSVMQTFSPWNEIQGIDFLSKTSVNNSAQVVMSVELYALTRQLAEKYDEDVLKNGNA